MCILNTIFWRTQKSSKVQFLFFFFLNYKVPTFFQSFSERLLKLQTKDFYKYLPKKPTELLMWAFSRLFSKECLFWWHLRIFQNLICPYFQAFYFPFRGNTWNTYFPEDLKVFKHGFVNIIFQRIIEDTIVNC